MLRITVELDKWGRGTEVTKLAELRIANDGSGTPTHGNYNAYTFGKRGRRQLRFGRVMNHPRQRVHVLTLVRKALVALGY